MIHEIQLDGREDLRDKKVDFANTAAKMAAELPATDVVSVRLMLEDGEDLLFEVKPGQEAEVVLEGLNSALAEREKALAAVRPPQGQPVAEEVVQDAVPAVVPDAAPVLEGNPVKESSLAAAAAEVEASDTKESEK